MMGADKKGTAPNGPVKKQELPVVNTAKEPTILKERVPGGGGYSPEVAQQIVDVCADIGISMVASLPDDWIAECIDRFSQDDRFFHVPVNREESAVGFCSGAYFSGTGSMALMGASGLTTVIYAITKINYTYEIPLFIMVTERGSMDDGAKFQISNGFYLHSLMQTINLPYAVIDGQDKLPLIGTAYAHSRKINRPTVALLTKALLQGKA